MPQIDRSKDRSGPLIPIEQAATEAGCTVADLLLLAEDGKLRLYMALHGYSAQSANTMGEKHPFFRSHGCPAGSDEYLLPAYARHLHRFGKTTVTHLIAENMPAIDGDDLWYWRLEEPQEVTVEQIFISRGHVVADAGGQKKQAGRPREAWKRDLAADLLDELLVAYGYEPGRKSPWTADTVHDGMQSIEKAVTGCNRVFSIKTKTLRVWLPDLFPAKNRKQLPRRGEASKLHAVTAQTTEEYFTSDYWQSAE